MKRILLALILAAEGLTTAMAAEQVLVVDDAHLQAPGAQPAVYTFNASETLVVDATNYQFKVPPHFANMPINSLQLALSPDQLYAVAWATSTPRLVLSQKNLSPIPGSKPFAGLKAGQEGSIALGNFDAGKFSVVWAGRSSCGERAMSKTEPTGTPPASALIDDRIASLGGWRGEMLAALRALLHEAVPGIAEEWKWNNPVWSLDGIVCTGEAYKAAVKMTFPKGASLADPKQLFNASLEGNVRRAIDFKEGDKLDKAALKALFKAAARANQAAKK